MYYFTNAIKYIYIASIISLCGILCKIPCWLVIITYVFYALLECTNDRYLKRKVRRTLLSRIISKKIEVIIKEERKNAESRTRVDDSS